MPITITKKYGRETRNFEVYTSDELDGIFGSSIVQAADAVGRQAELDESLTYLNEVTLPGLQNDLNNMNDVEIVDTLPTTDNYEGRIVFLTTDDKLYRWNGTAWTSAVPAVDITGEITETQITDGAISTPKLAANAVTAAKIEALTITAAEIAANAITADKIIAGAISTAKLDANAVTAAKIAANTITANEIAANTITANEILAGTITAAEIDVANLFAQNITLTGSIQSNNFVTDVSGWRINSAGDAEFNNITARGVFDIETGSTINASVIEQVIKDVVAPDADFQPVGTGDNVQFNNLDLTGTINYINETNLQVTDKTLTLNKNGSDASATSANTINGITVNGSGIIIERDVSDDHYMLWNDTDGFLFSDTVHAIDFEVDNEWLLGTEVVGGINRLSIRGQAGNQDVEIFLHPIGTATHSRIEVSNESQLINYNSIALESNGTAQTLISRAEGNATVLPMQIRVAGQESISLWTNDIERFSIDHTSALFDVPTQSYDGFASGFAGYGTLVDYVNDEIQTTDLTVRGIMRVYELLINQIRATNGSLWVSSAAKAEGVQVDTPVAGQYTITLGEDTYVPFAAGDLIRAQRFTGSGVYQVNGTVVSINNAPTAPTFVMTIETGSSVPAVGMEFVRIGNDGTTANRQGAVYLTSDDSGAPYIDIINDVNSHNAFNTQATFKARFGNLVGINDPDMGQLSGYGLYAENAYLKGTVYANAGEIAQWDIIGSEIKSTVSDSRIVMDSNYEYTSGSFSPSFRMGANFGAGVQDVLEINANASSPPLLHEYASSTTVADLHLIGSTASVYTFDNTPNYNITQANSNVTYQYDIDMSGASGGVIQEIKVILQGYDSASGLYTGLTINSYAQDEFHDSGLGTTFSINGEYISGNIRDFDSHRLFVQVIKRSSGDDYGDVYIRNITWEETNTTIAINAQGIFRRVSSSIVEPLGGGGIVATTVSSVFGRTGDITAQSGDYNFTQIDGASTYSVTNFDDITSALITQWNTAYTERGSVIAGTNLTWNGNQLDATDTNTWRGIDDTPVDGQTSESISSNWAFDHVNASNPHGTTASDVGVDKAFIDSLNVDADTLDGVDSSGFIRDFGTATLANLNTIPVTSGKYRWNNTTVGRPASTQANEYGTVLNLNYDGTQSTQIAYDISQENLWTRKLDTGTDAGTTWHKVWTDNNLTSNSQLSNGAGYYTANDNVSFGTGNFSGTVSVPDIQVGGNILFNVNTTGDYIGYATQQGITYYENGSATWRLSGNGDNFINGGNVGIGTTSPSYKLDVNGAGRFTGGGDATTQGIVRVTDGGGGRQLILKSSYQGIGTATVDTITADLAFAVDGVNAMYIESSNRNVGIGTTSPSYTLDVSGTGRFTGAVDFGGNVDFSGNLRIINGDRTAVTSELPFIYHNGGTSRKIGFAVYDDSNIRNYIELFEGNNHTSQYIELGINNTSALHIDANGDTEINGRLIVGAGGNNEQVRARHLDGKNTTDDNYGTLYLNYYSSGTIVIGNGGGDTTVSNSLTVNSSLAVNGSSNQIRSGITGGYAGTGGTGSSNWGNNIWSIGTSWSGSGYGSGYTIASNQYGLSWLRDSHPSANSTADEGLYLFRSSATPYVALGYNGAVFNTHVYITGTNISYASDHQDNSDRRIKTDLELHNPLDIAKHAVLYKYNKRGVVQFGVMAQDMMEYDKDIVGTRPDEEFGEIYTLSGYSLGAIALSGVGELDKKFSSETDRLKERVKELEEKVTELGGEV